MATARAERRLAAILAADAVGYSALVEQDEAATLAALRDLRRETLEPLLAEHRGRVVKLMGDGVLAEFGSAVDAVACAASLQRAVSERQAGVPEERRVVLRIGINLGDVVVEADGDLLGDGINVAARLEQFCEPGDVAISGTAYDHLHGKSTGRSSTSASACSRTLHGRYASTGCAPIARRGLHARSCCYPTGRRLPCSLLPT